MTHRYAYLDSHLPIAFAHRGGAAQGDENTMAAFARAVATGYTYLETDVRATADDVAVVFHDATLDRVLGRAGRIEDLRWADLSSERSGGEPVVSTLADLLDAWPQCRLNVDLKTDAVLEPAIEAIWKVNARDRVLLASFDDQRIRWARKICGPRQATSMGQREVAALRLGSLRGRGLFGFRPDVAAVQVPLRHRRIPVVDARFVRHAHRVGLQVHVWTIDEPAEMNRLLDLGVDGIMTDRIDALRDVLIERRCWPAGDAGRADRIA